MEINWITISVADLEKSKEFYGEYLGLKKENEMSPNEFMSIVFFEAENGMKVELIYNRNAENNRMNQGMVSLGIVSSNYDKLLQQAREKEILTAEPAILGGHMECFFVSDPNGVGIQIIKNK